MASQSSPKPRESRHLLRAMLSIPRLPAVVSLVLSLAASVGSPASILSKCTWRPTNPNRAHLFHVRLAAMNASRDNTIASDMRLRSTAKSVSFSATIADASSRQKKHSETTNAPSRRVELAGSTVDRPGPSSVPLSWFIAYFLCSSVVITFYYSSIFFPWGFMDTTTQDIAHTFSGHLYLSRTSLYHIHSIFVPLSIALALPVYSALGIISP